MAYALTPTGSERWFSSRTDSSPTRRPNIVFILADDLGWADLGCYGATEISTPNLDRMAGSGIRFTHAYAPSPWCSASRIGLYTGRYPGRLPAGLEEPLRTRDAEHGLPPDHPTLASMLGEVGYSTAMFGKWHCGFLPWFSPMKSGFQRFYGCIDGAIDYHEHIGTLGLPDLWEGETPIEETGYFTDMISEQAAAYVRDAGDDPFYVQLNYTAPHWPWEGRDDAAVGAEIRRRYEEKENALPLFHHDGGSLAKYAELVESMHDGIGLVLDALDEAGVAENTIICFSSDNGGERWSKNWPFVGQKGDINEGGIRVPFIVRWPDGIDGRQVSADPTSMLDWTATLLSIAGVEPDPAYPLDGTNLHGWLLDGDPFPEHDLYWRVASQSALRRGRFKLVVNQRPEAMQGNWPMRGGRTWVHFYDVSDDGREAADLREHHHELVEAMRAALDDFDEQMLTYPADHPHLPGHATASRPAVSQPD